MDIFEALKEKACSVSLSARTKKECLLELARLIAEANEDIRLEEILNALESREEQGSTGLEDGIAIPHARLKDIPSFILGIAVSKKGMNFESIDGKKAHIFFVLVGPENKPQEYIKLLAQVSRVARNKVARREMRKASTPSALKETFLRYIPEGVPLKDEKGQNKLFILVLYEKRYLDDIIQLFLEADIHGASVIDSMGIGNVLSRVPLFGDLMNFLGERKEVSKTIMAIINEIKIPGLVEGIEDIMGDLDTHSGAMVFTLDINFMKGSFETL